MCVQACPTQTLQLLHLEAGFSGLWTPAVTPRVGGCQADCTACGDVCPTNAIVEFTKHEADKWVTKMGTAVLEKSRCISWTNNTPCKKCIEACPTWAFEVEHGDGVRPFRPSGIKYDRCVGCGLCENACRKIVFGRPAILTFSHGRGQPTSLPYEPTEKLKNQGKG
jgi:NAD-dependent dihydropyrimidine dehydrogenase PreA subunit